LQVTSKSRVFKVESRVSLKSLCSSRNSSLKSLRASRKSQKQRLKSPTLPILCKQMHTNICVSNTASPECFA